MKAINSTIIMNLYQQIENLHKTLLSNENKANELRKIYEKLFKILLGYSAKEIQHSLHDMINDYINEVNKYELQYICHSLRKDLNPWSHDNPNRLHNNELDGYFTKFKNIIQSLAGIIYNETNQLKEFELSKLYLNEKQQKAVLSSSKITLVNAGPGTGKTYLIVGRVLNEINQRNDKKIFVLSFTNKASDELKHKIDEKIFSFNLAQFKKNIFTGTIHSFVLNTIQEYFSINNRSFDFIIIDELELKELQEEFGKNVQLVNQYLQDNKLLTFDKIINIFLKTIKNNEKFQQFISQYLDEMIIDEAQDLDKSQYEVLFFLNKYIKDLKLFFVGDQRQNIYAFKGGSLNNILDFFHLEKDFALIELEYSYRCPQNTLTFVNQFGFNDCKNIPLKTANNNNGNILKIEEFDNMEEEGDWIAKLIQSKRRNASLLDISIIYSTTFYFKNILESLNAFKIPFKVMGGQYYLNRDIKLIRYILNLVYTSNKFALKNIQNHIIKTEIGTENIDDVLIPLSDMNFEGKDNYKHLSHILKFVKTNENTSKAILEILIDLIQSVESKKLFDIKFLDILLELKTIIENDLTLDKYEKFKLSFSPMHPKLGVFYSRSDEIVLSEYYEDGKEFVTITTIHSSKGLEWDSVIIPGMSQDGFPRYFKYEDDKTKELPNELKKFYVACTRTKQNLYFTRSILNPRGYKKEKSIFLNNIDKVKIYI